MPIITTNTIQPKTETADRPIRTVSTNPSGEPDKGRFVSPEPREFVVPKDYPGVERRTTRKVEGRLDTENMVARLEAERVRLAGPAKAAPAPEPPAKKAAPKKRAAKRRAKAKPKE